MHPQYGAPAYTGREGLAIAALALGIVALVLFCIPYLALPAAILAIVFGAVALKSASRSMAMAGLICGTVSVVVTLITMIVLASALFSVSRGLSDMVSDLTVSTNAQPAAEAWVKKELGSNAKLSILTIERQKDGTYKASEVVTLSNGMERSFECTVQEFDEGSRGVGPTITKVQLGPPQTKSEAAQSQ